MANDLWFGSDEYAFFAKDDCENIIHSGDDIDVKYSYDETVSRESGTVKKDIPTNQPVFVTHANGHLQATTTSTLTADLLNSLKKPIIKLQRLQPCRKYKSLNIVADADATLCIIKADLIKKENDEYVDNSMSSNKSVTAEEETKKCENDSSEKKPYKCSICGKGFTQKRNLQTHGKLHHKEKPYACFSCNKSFTMPSLLKRHEECHAEERLFTCSVCSKSFKTLRALKTHETVHSEKKPHTCNICFKSFKRLTHLKTHQHIHPEEIPYKCIFCSTSFERLADLKTHEAKLHNKGRSYVCSICEKQVSDSAALKIHYMCHTGEKPFTCSICSKSFRSTNNLKAHEKTHSEQKPYKCPHCEKSFVEQTRLNRHVKLYHASTKQRFNCSLCSKSYGRLSHLKDHETVHSGEKPYKCSFCLF